MIADLKFALRQLAKTPGFTFIAVLTLALGIGANTAIFSVINTVLLRPLPFPGSRQLVALAGSTKTLPDMAVAYPDYLDWRTQQKVFAEMGARLQAGGVITGAGEPERVFGRFVTASFFSTLIVQPQIGRFFTAAEDKPNGERVMVISDALWKRRFDGDPSIVGRPITYNGESWIIIGVLPRNFEFYGRTNENNDFFIPLGRLTDKSFMQDRGSRNLRVIARLASGVTLAQAQTAMTSLAARLASQYPVTNSEIGVRVRSLLDDDVGNSRPGLLLASLGAILVLLIACANLAHLMFARGSARSKEIAVRLAIGGSRSRIVRLLLAESLLIALAGGALGVMTAVWAADAFKAGGSEIIPRIDQLSIDFRVLTFSALAIAASAAVFGLLPAMQSARVDLNTSLKSAAGEAGRDPRRSIRRGLVVAELTLALSLLITAGLLTKSFWLLINVSPGFDPDNVLTFRLRLPDAKYPDAARAMTAVSETRQRISELNGVKSTAVCTGFPLGRANQNAYRLESQPEPANVSQWPLSLALLIDENYCRALGITLVAGRTFTASDNAQSPAVVLVDEEFARLYFGENARLALGHRLQFSGDGEPWREIVGVVAHVAHSGLEERAAPEIYRPWTQLNPQWSADYLRAMDFVVKTAGAPGAILGELKNELRKIDPDLPLGNVRSLPSLLTQSTAARRLNLFVIGAFAFLAVTLSAIGLYGVTSYTVEHRTREIGIRMAVGARPHDVLLLVVREAAMVAGIGTLLGIMGAFAITRLLNATLFGVSTNDLLIYTSSALALFIIAIVACLRPALRAAHVNPVIALRAE